jgi:hypothetical protein
MATTFNRVSDSDAMAGETNFIAINELGFYSLTAVKAGSGKLLLINWVTGDHIARLQDSGQVPGVIDGLAVTRNLNRTVTAVSLTTKNLRLTSWDDGSGQGPITKLAEAVQPEHALDINIQPIDSNVTVANLVTAHRTSGDKLKLIAWQLDGGTGTITKLGDSGDQDKIRSLGDYRRIAMSTLGEDIVVTAVRTATGNLKVITWGISRDGTRISRLGDSGDWGIVKEIAIADTVTAVRTDSGRLRLASWDISPDGTSVTSYNTKLEGDADWITICRFDPSGRNPARYVVGLRAGNKRLKLIAYDVDSTGSILRTGDSDKGAESITGKKPGVATRIALSPAVNYLVAAMRDGSDNLKLINWKMVD